jgi:predicted GH43/DUF377 family glycosyl hydrolase
MLGRSLLYLLLIVCASSHEFMVYTVTVAQRDTQPLLSYLVQNNSVYKQVFNPTWMPPSAGTAQRKGLIIRTQDCDYKPEGCVFCGGSAQKASLLTFSEQVDGKFANITASSIVFTPSSFADSWGTEDPRMVYNRQDAFYYMTYTAYNGSSILMSLARSKNPTDRDSWERLGPVFPDYQNSKSGAILIRDSAPHYLFWGDSDIRVTKSSNISKWDSIGDIFLSPRADHFDSRLVESGPPPLLLSTGDYLFFYNSAEKGWPEDPKTAYHVGWVILDGNDPAKIKQRSEVPLMGPEYSWEKGEAPYLCNVPNVVFL